MPSKNIEETIEILEKGLENVELIFTKLDNKEKSKENVKELIRKMNLIKKKIEQIEE